MARQRDEGSRRRKHHTPPPTSLDRAFLDALQDFREPGEQGAATPSPAAPDGICGAPPTPGAGDLHLGLRVTADGMRVVLHELDAGGARFTAEALAAALRDQYGICYGLDQDMLKHLASQAAAGPVRGEFTVAEGTPPEPGQDGRLIYLFLGPGQQEPTLPFQQLVESLEEDSLDEALGRNLRARMVTPGEYLATRVPPTQTCLAAPGQELARRVAPTPGKAGRDVYGHPCDRPGRDIPLQAGRFVEQEENRYVARLYGYVCVLGEVISVLPPIWVSPDRMEAHFVHFPEISPSDPPAPAWVRQGLAAAGVTCGILESEIELLCSRPLRASDKTSALVARGSPAVPGRDSRIQFAVDYETRAGRLREDGSIDLRERNTAVGVAVDQLLGEVTPATQGQPGCTLDGQVLPALDGQERDFAAGENVRGPTEDGLMRFYAQIDGIIQVKGDTVQVNPVLQISGDVNYETGNLDLPRDVQISGDVLAGFTVVAGGNIAIGGIVENGAVVRAGGDVVAARGIVGEETRVIAQGNVEAKFIQNSSVLARGDVVVGSYIFNATVRAGGEVVVQAGGGQRGGSIVGGEVIATVGVTARRIGSADTGSTIVGLGASLSLMARQQKLQEALGAAAQRLRRLVVLLGIDEADAAMAAAVARRAPAPRRPHVQELATELETLLRTRQESIDGLAAVEEEMVADLRAGRIRASEKVYGGVRIRAGEAISAVPEDVDQAIFYLTDTGIRWRPLQAGDLQGESRP